MCSVGPIQIHHHQNQKSRRAHDLRVAVVAAVAAAVVENAPRTCGARMLKLALDRARRIVRGCKTVSECYRLVGGAYDLFPSVSTCCHRCDATLPTIDPLLQSKAETSALLLVLGLVPALAGLDTVADLIA